jgi:hypothetical protein
MGGTGCRLVAPDTRTREVLRAIAVDDPYAMRPHPGGVLTSAGSRCAAGHSADSGMVVTVAGR